MTIVARVLIAVALASSFAAPIGAEEKAAPAFDPSIARRITPEEVQQRQKGGKKPIIIDTRESLGDDIVKGAVVVPADRLEAWAKDVPKKALIVAYCT